MISSVRGQVLRSHLDHAVIEVGGVGLAVRTTPGTLAGLRRGEQARLATTLVVREDSLTLFGFADDEPSGAVRAGADGVRGRARIALALLAVLDPDAAAPRPGRVDTATLTRAPGIGPRVAERLVLELKDKVGAAGPPPGAPGPADGSGTALPGQAGRRRWSGWASPPRPAERSPWTEALAADADGDVGVLLRGRWPCWAGRDDAGRPTPFADRDPEVDAAS